MEATTESTDYEDRPAKRIQDIAVDGIQTDAEQPDASQESVRGVGRYQAVRVVGRRASLGAIKAPRPIPTATPVMPSAIQAYNGLVDN